MPARKDSGPQQPRQVRKSLMVDADKLTRARALLGAASDAETLRLALDHLLSHYEAHLGEEE
jgi:hypothetical protein